MKRNTRGGQNVISLDIFAYIFGRINVTGFSIRLLLVFLKNCMSSACLLYQIQYIENSWSDSMTDFNKIRHRPAIEFLTLENVQTQQIYKRMTVVYGEDVLSYPMVTRWAAEFRQGIRSIQVEPR